MLTDSKGNFIGGQWKKAKGKEFFSLSPSSGNIIWQGFQSSFKDIDEAIYSARDGFNLWSKLKISERLAYLKSFVDILKTNKSSLSKCISLEIGKPLWESNTEVSAMIGKLEPTIQSFNQRNIDISREQGNGLSITRFRPHGIISVIGPYNFPGHMPNGHIMPALLAGNTVIFKPSEIAPAVAEMIVEFWKISGLPAGVLNLVQGDGSIGQYLCQQENINGIFFTGSRQVGEKIRSLASVDKICVLEMGGNSPLIVWDSSDINSAVFATIQSAFITSGQRCSEARRLILPSNKFGKIFINRLISTTRKIHVGKFDEIPEPYMGPLRQPIFVDNLLKEQEILMQKGARSLLKCERLSLGDSFVSPGIIDVTKIINREDKEILGPLLQVIWVEDFNNAIKEANNTKYGLAAGIFSEDASLYERFQNEIKAGIINWNQQLTGASPWAPFGGLKESGNYRPSGYLASDYCVYSTGSIEFNKLQMPTELPPGLELDLNDNNFLA